jgi:hypothetical protein
LFSALITGIAIVHTTGMPVVYSFELDEGGSEVKPEQLATLRAELKDTPLTLNMSLNQNGNSMQSCHFDC